MALTLTISGTAPADAVSVTVNGTAATITAARTWQATVPVATAVVAVSVRNAAGFETIRTMHLVATPSAPV